MVSEHVKPKEDWIHTMEMLDDSKGMVSRVYKHLGLGAYRFMITGKIRWKQKDKNHVWLLTVQVQDAKNLSGNA